MTGGATTSEPWSGVEATRPRAIGTRRVAISLLVAGLLAAGAWLLVGQLASYSKLVVAVRRADGWWLLIALLGGGVSYLGYALLYQTFSRLERGPRPPLWLTIRLAVAIFGASVLATSAGRLGSEYWSLRRMHVKPASAWSRVLALNTAAWAALALLAWLGSLALVAGAGDRPSFGVELAWLLVPPLCALPAAYLASGRRRALAEDRGGRLRRTAAAVVRSLQLLRTAAHEPARRRGAAGAVVYWGAELLIVWAALRAFGVHLGPAGLAVAYATGYASTILPLPAGGAGGVDAASAYSLTLVGVPLGPALLATVVQRLCTYWLPIGLAVLSARSIRRLPNDLSSVGATVTAG